MRQQQPSNSKDSLQGWNDGKGTCGHSSADSFWNQLLDLARLRHEALPRIMHYAQWSDRASQHHIQHTTPLQNMGAQLLLQSFNYTPLGVIMQ